MDNKKLARQFEKSLIKHDMLLEQEVVGDNLFSTALKVIGDGYINKACQHMEQLCSVIESPIEELMLYGLILSAQEEVGDIGFVVNGSTFGDCGLGAEFIVIEPQAKIENYRADFLLTYKSSFHGFEKDRQLIVECDGHDFHDKTKQQASRDKERDREMKKLGYEVFRFTGSDIWNDVYSCSKEAIDMVTGITEMKRVRKAKSTNSKNQVNQKAEVSKKYSDIRSAMEGVLSRIENTLASESFLSGISTGFADIDQIISGLNPSDLIVLAARPSMGKTALSMNIADHVAQNSGKHVLVFSLGMSEGQLTKRLLASNGMIDLDAINSTKMDENCWERISVAASKLMHSKMLIDSDGGLSPDEIFNRARSAGKDHELGLIVVDYLQLIPVPELSGNRGYESADITRTLKAMAKELNVPVIALSQLSRKLERRADKRPTNSDLPDFGSIEQDADVIMFIYRDEVYHDDSPDKGLAEIIIGKQRNGTLGKVRLTFQGEYSRFCSFAGPSFREDD